jgi:hypothetical protein
MFILYKSFNNAVFSIQIEDIKHIYTKKIKNVIKKMAYFKKPTTITGYPVSLTNADGINVIVYYARDNYNKTMFEASTKYIRATEDPESWSFDDGTQELWMNGVLMTDD